MSAGVKEKKSVISAGSQENQAVIFDYAFFTLPSTPSSFAKDEPKQVTRESWMTELPPELKSFGFGPRTFKRRADDKSGDRSIWTDTPADRERKAKVSIYLFIHIDLQAVGVTDVL